MPDLGPILANLVSMDPESLWGFDQRERFKAFRFHLRPSHRLILFFFSPSPPFLHSSHMLSLLFIESSPEEKSLLASFHSYKWKLRFLSIFLLLYTFLFFPSLSLIPNSFLISSFAKVYSRFKIYTQNRVTSDKIGGTRRKREI